MKKVKNDSQPFIIYIIPIFVLPFVASFVGLVFYGILSSFDGVNFGSMYGILVSVIFLYLIMRAIKNGILYFIPREECYIEDNNLIYRRIFYFSKIGVFIKFITLISKTLLKLSHRVIYFTFKTSFF